MKVVILAGGFGTRLSEETSTRPKPMVEIGGKPILWHIMKHYSFYGFNDFVICLGYKGYMIKEYFANYYLHNSDVTFDLKTNETSIHRNSAEDWKVTCIDTGANSMTGGRILRVKDYLNDEPFFLTYGDGVSDVDIIKAYDFHKENNRLLTVTAVQPGGKYGKLVFGSENNNVTSFQEKPDGDGNWINGGFFVCQPEVLNYLTDDSTIFEREPLENLAKDDQISAYKHKGFWKAMDTLKDKMDLNQLWEEGRADWKQS